MLGNIGLSSSSSVHVQVCWRTCRDFIAREGVRVFPGVGFVELRMKSCLFECSMLLMPRVPLGS